jgi:hypothetical protein
VFTRGHTVVAPSAADDLRQLLISGRKSKQTLTEIAKAAVNLQLENWRRSEAARADSKDAPFTLFGVDFTPIYHGGQLGSDLVKNCKSIEDVVRKNPDSLNAIIWTWAKLPYSIRCAGEATNTLPEPKASEGGPAKKKARVEGEGELVEDIDEW